MDLEVPWLLLNSANLEEKNLGILLLTLTKFPFDDHAHNDVLLELLQKANKENEVENWSVFIKHNHSLAKAKNWRETLEFILSRPYSYTQKILETALGRYIELSGERTFQVNEEALGLPKYEN